MLPTPAFFLYFPMMAKIIHAMDVCQIVQNQATSLVQNLNKVDGCGNGFSHNAAGFSQNLAAMWLRTLFHDGGSWFEMAAFNGIDGSILNELDAEEAKGLAAGLVVIGDGGKVVANPIFNTPLAQDPVTPVDSIAIAALTAISHCGGPSIQLQVNRTFLGFGEGTGTPPNNPSSYNQSSAIPSDPTLSSNDLFNNFFSFPNMGFTKQQMFAIVTGSHSLGGVHHAITPAFAQGNLFLSFDDTPTVFDNHIFVKLARNSSDCVLPIDCHMAQDPDLAPFLKTWAEDQNAFFAAYEDAMKFMLTFNENRGFMAPPSGQRCPFSVPKHNYNQDTLAGSATAVPFQLLPRPSRGVQLMSYTWNGTIFSGSVLVQQVSPGNSVTIHYDDSNGVWNSKNALAGSYAGPVAQFPGYAIWTFSQSVLSIKSFYVEYTASGTAQYDNNGGSNYPVTGFQSPQGAFVKVGHYTYDLSVLQGKLIVSNAGFTKTITIYWVDGVTGSWSHAIAATYVAPSAEFPGYEVWSFSEATDVPAVAFFVEYDVNGVKYYDNNRNANYLL